MAASSMPTKAERLSAYSPDGRLCLVTGGTQGIGRAVVEELAGLGAKVFTCARNAADLASLLEQSAAAGWDVDGVVADVSQASDRQLLMQAVSDAFGGQLNVLFNNVGTNIRQPTVDFTQEDFQRLIAINLESAFAMSQLAHPLLKASGDGIVIFNSSVAGGPTAMQSGSVYGLTKAALNQMARNFTCEWAAKDHIRAVSVAPWYTATPLAQQVLQDEEYERKVLERTPMGRIAQPQEVARVVSFLASPASSYMAGSGLRGSSRRLHGGTHGEAPRASRRAEDKCRCC
ncbi:hypothetical protein D9Q98_000541 [Chlorella vulgaris]|uniref:Uncharacterized protein n=1 Tax=Chlorella vulgaris TaxID=3077 RepID=A0A9D4Z1N4_CHLVU|nr:hypothetical protein D9Q98_000541 [Chlorella vulgaris]